MSNGKTPRCQIAEIQTAAPVALMRGRAEELTTPSTAINLRRDHVERWLLARPFSSRHAPSTARSYSLPFIGLAAAKLPWLYELSIYHPGFDPLIPLARVVLADIRAWARSTPHPHRHTIAILTAVPLDDLRRWKPALGIPFMQSNLANPRDASRRRGELLPYSTGGYVAGVVYGKMSTA